MTHAHLSMRYNRDVDDAARAIRSLVRGHGTATLTEARRFGGAMGELDGFRLVQHRGTEGQSECALLVDEADFVRDLGPILLSNVPIPRRGGWFTHAVGAVTRSRGGILGIHMPSGVEGRTGFRDDHPGQVRAYRAAIGALRQYVAEHPDVNEIWADWNLDARKPWVRAYFARHFPEFWILAPDSGSYGPRVIDYALIRKGHGDWAATVVNNPASDHEAVIATLQEATVGHLPANLPTILRARGLTVVEVDGWHGRGRPASTGGFDPVGVLCHHTATSRSSSDAAVLRLLVNGRSDLPGPLCQIGLGRDGTVYLVASGRANHAGRAKASGTVAAGDGNALYVGVEAFNDGVGEPWSMAQYGAYVTLCAALCADVTGNSVRTVRAHKETSSTGKIDPTFDMGDFRDDVQYRLDEWAASPRRPAHPTDEEIDMTPDELRQIIREEIDTAFRGDDRSVLDLGKARVEDPDTGTGLTLARWLKSTRDEVRAIAKKVGA